jgi:hypothetical protein
MGGPGSRARSARLRVGSLLAAIAKRCGVATRAVAGALASDPEDRPLERAAVRLIVPGAFVAAVVISALVAYRSEEAPSIAFENHLVFAGELFLLSFYGLLLALVPLMRAVASGELPIELTSRGARFPEKAVKGSLVANQELLERVESIEAALEGQKVFGDTSARRAAEGLLDLEDELKDLRADLIRLERKEN